MVRSTAKKTAPAAPTTVTVTGCHLTNQAPAANEHTRAAVEALANAAAENAQAISAIAKALQGGNAVVDTMIRIGN